MVVDQIDAIPSVEETIGHVGSTVSYQEYTFIRDMKKMRVFIPQIKVNGQMVAVPDDETISGLYECNSRNKAMEKAKEVRNRLRKKKKHFFKLI